MPVPKFKQLFRPILALAKEQPITRRSATEAMASHFQLTPEERAERVPSGASTLVANRAGWTMTYLRKARLIEKVEKYTYRATQAGIDFLQLHPESFSISDLRTIEGFSDALKGKGKSSKSKSPDASGNDPEADKTPLERLEEAAATLEESLRSELLDQLAQVDPFRFEQVVLDVLTAMGYGGSLDAATVTQRSNDEGIDGIINEDRLGLDVIYVQAKRWKNTVGRKEIQSFVGALAGKQAQKGVFITTSNFSDTAHDYAKGVSQRVILIDGARLSQLMVEHDVGVSTSQTVRIKRIDSDYFEEG